MHFIDTHLHLQDYKQKCATDIITSFSSLGGEKLICVAAIEEDWGKIDMLSLQFPKVIIPAFGLHPWYVDKMQPDWEKRLAILLKRYPHALIGETGLDRLHNKESELQNVVFQKQVELAKTFRRPLIIHAVKAQDWLQGYWKELPAKFVFHSYNGRVEMLSKILQSGGYVSFSASILKNRDFVEVVKTVPVDKLLVETDGPYQSPVLGEEVEPSFIPELVTQIAQARGESFQQLATQIYQNSEEFIKPW